MENEEEKIVPQEAKLNKNVLIVGGGIFVLLVGLILTVFLYLIPNGHYKKGVSNFDSGNYQVSYDEFTAAGDYKDSVERAAVALKGSYYQQGLSALEEFRFDDARNYLYSAGDFPGAPETYAIIDNEEIYHGADVSFTNGEYEAAAQIFLSLEDYRDSSDRYVASIYALADSLYDAGEYYDAANYFVDIEDYEDSLDRATECGNILFENEEYGHAATVFGNVGDTDFCNYSRGLMHFNNGSYADAANYFNNAGDFRDAPEMVMKSYFYRAESYYTEGDLPTAYDFFLLLPEDLVVDGIAVSDRIAMLESHQEFMNICGRWRSTDNEFRCCETFTYYGTSYWLQEDMYGCTLDVTCIIDDDGSVRVHGTANYFMFTSYSTISAYCGYSFDEVSTFYFRVEPGSSIPRSFDGTSNASFTYSNGIFRLQRTDTTWYTSTYYDSFTADITFDEASFY